MAKHDRCQICDYSETNGAPYLQLNPGQNGAVRRTTLPSGEVVYRCEACSDSISECLADMFAEDSYDGMDTDET